MNSIANFLKESKQYRDASDHNPIVIAPGRFNPPHRGHKLMIDKLVELGEELNAQPIVLIIDSGKYGSKNPLTGEVRKHYLEKMYPGVRFEIFKNPYEAVLTLSDRERLIPVGSVTGKDRGDSYKEMVGRIFGKNAIENYRSEVLHRDPDLEDDVKGFSASKARRAALENDVVAFRIITGLEDSEARELMRKLVDGMKESE